MAFLQHDPDPEADPERGMARLLGPGQVDQQIRQAVQTCWMMLPPNRRNIAEVEKEIRRIVERALQNLRDDAASFEISS